jgi:capsular exopolysaccharide synthesis family protein
VSRTREALKKAEAEAMNNGASRVAWNPPRSSPELRDSRGSGLEYERIGAWLTNQSIQGKRIQTVMVVAPCSGTGNTTTAAFLAETLAGAKNRRVLIIDSNFRTPSLNAVFQVKNNGGFVEVASNGVPFEAHIQPTNRQNLFVLTSGQVSVGPSDIFESDALDELLVQLKTKFDMIIFDAAPVVEFPDSFALAPKVDSIILVIQSERTSIEQAQQAKRYLEQAGGHIMGVVLNRQQDYTPPFLKKFLRNGSSLINS